MLLLLTLAGTSLVYPKPMPKTQLTLAFGAPTLQLSSAPPPTSALQSALARPPSNAAGQTQAVVAPPAAAAGSYTKYTNHRRGTIIKKADVDGATCLGEVAAELESHGIRVTSNLSSDKLGAKIREARMMRIPYLAVIGEKEVEGRGLAVRSRDENKDLGFMPLADVVTRLQSESLPPSARGA